MDPTVSNAGGVFTPHILCQCLICRVVEVLVWVRGS